MVGARTIDAEDRRGGSENRMVGRSDGHRYLHSLSLHRQTSFSPSTRLGFARHHIMADNAQRPRPPPNRRRDKVQLSCDPCRRRKYVLDSHRSRARLPLPGCGATDSTHAELAQGVASPSLAVMRLHLLRLMLGVMFSGPLLHGSPRASMAESLNWRALS